MRHVMVSVRIGVCFFMLQLGGLGHDEPGINEYEVAIDKLLSERESPEEFERIVLSARKHGVSEQAILETRFLFHIDRSEDEKIAALLPQFLERKDRFRVSDTAIFGSEDDWLAVVEYVHALDALQTGDHKAFKNHITEAFWLSPKQGSAFAHHVERIRLSESMKAVQFDFSKLYRNLFEPNEELSLSLATDKKALLLHFWSPSSKECKMNMEDFFLIAEQLSSQGIEVASILPENTEETVKNASTMLRAKKKKLAGTWLIDSATHKLSIQLKIQTVPTMVLISPKGKVLFNGHPADEDLWTRLNELNSSIQRLEADISEQIK